MDVCLACLWQQRDPCGQSRGMGREGLGRVSHGGSCECCEGLGLVLGRMGWNATGEGYDEHTEPRRRLL